ncbi:Rhodanese-like domain-containing protein [Russula earlei]|uniref:Rhodanese-like domain-containing protein n=1 Tax=Russula earlei TaxID=71964 RepID=A0ACC0ULJ0_9AGAM|nr:Rhodanese-like domain-containing protein [Russula earlei]
MSVRYISRDDLSEIIKSDKRPGEDYLVVDVRDSDFVGGNIPNCRRSPSLTFSGDLDDLIRDTKDVPRVIFHCALSQARGPTAAQQYVDRRAQPQHQQDNNTKQEVLVLQGGFVGFQRKFKDDPELVEKWSKDIWGA